MDPFTAAIGGSLISGLFGFAGQRSANETNIELGREQMAFQERMSGTAYQRAVTDMRSAGLNPMLAYSQGGASAPVGSMPQVQNAAGAGVSTAAQAMATIQAVQSIAQSEAQTAQLKAGTDKIRSETLENSLHSAKLAADVDQAKAGAFKSTEEGFVSRHEAAIRDVKKQVETGRPGFEHTGFAADVRRRKAEARLAELGIPVAEAEAKFAGETETLPKYLRMLIELLRGGASARSIGR